VLPGAPYRRAGRKPGPVIRNADPVDFEAIYRGLAAAYFWSTDRIDAMDLDELEMYLSGDAKPAASSSSGDPLRNLRRRTNVSLEGAYEQLSDGQKAKLAQQPETTPDGRPVFGSLRALAKFVRESR
jgi:hypothetical protein